MLPQRKRLPHEVPLWVPDGSRYFITINCHGRGSDALCGTGAAARLIESIDVYERLGKWQVSVMVVMPDHIHLIGSFARDPGVTPTVRGWKAYHAKQSGLRWQSGFFEHRLRNDQEFTEKISYVLMNPVRKGLVSEWSAWPHMFVRGDWPTKLEP